MIDKLAARGIGNAAAQMGWKEGRKGWNFPVFGLDGGIDGGRWKAYDSSAQPKYRWTGDSRPEYYHAGIAFRDALLAAYGTLYIVNGEPAVLTMLEAGYFNALCWFDGELSIPHNLPADLKALGVTRVRYYPDRDETGLKAACKIRDVLAETGIEFDCRELPNTLPEKADLNDLWQAVGFDHEAFTQALETAPTMVLPEPKPATVLLKSTEREITPPAPGAVDWDSERRSFWTGVVLPAVERAATGQRGKHFRCVNPHHDDGNPSARISTDKDPDGLYICTCGTHSRDAVAGWFGLDFMTWWRDNRQPLYPRQRRTQTDTEASPARPPELNTKAVRYVSDDLSPSEMAKLRSLLIQAPTGVGKSTAAGRYVDSLPENKQVTGVAQYRLLTQSLCAQLGAMHYEDLTGKNRALLKSATRLVTSITSAYKFDRRGGIVIADEIEGDLKFLSQSKTFKPGERIATYRAVKALFASAEQLIGMDANLSDITISWIKSIRGEDATVKRYTHTTERGKVNLLKNRDAALWQIRKLLSHGRGTVYVACSWEQDASDIADLFNDVRTLKITTDSSHTPKVEAFRENANGERQQYDLVIYTAAMGAGVDISEPVYAQVGIFHQTPLSPEDAIQLYGRVRNAQKYYAAVPAHSEGYATETAAQLIANKIKYERWTAAQRGAEPDIAGDHLELLTLWARFEERRRRENARWRFYFISRLATNGYSTQDNNATAPKAFSHMLKEWRVQRKDANWDFILAAAGEALPTDGIEALRPKGIEITRDLKLRNVRYLVEQALGHEDVTNDDRDLMNSHGRRRHHNLVDLLLDESELLKTDREQAAGEAVQQRDYKLLNRRILDELLALVGFTGDTVKQQVKAFKDYFHEQRDVTEVNNRFQAWKSDRALLLFKELSHHGNNARTPSGLCRWLLGQFGLKLISTRHGRGEERYMAYQLDVEISTYRTARAERAAKCTKNVQETPKAHFWYTSTQSTDQLAPIVCTPFKPLELPGKVYQPPPKGGSLNPFSKAAAS